MIYELTPQQDLHGYANPWPASGNDNQFGVKDGTYAGANYRSTVVKDSLITVNGTGHLASGVIVATAPMAAALISGSLPAGTYQYMLFDFETNIPNLQKADVLLRVKYEDTTTANLTQGTAFTAAGSFTPDAIIKGTNITWEKGRYVKFKVMLVSGSTAPTAFSPYENICPITPYELPGSDDPFYGGLLNSNTGVLLSGYAAVDLGDLSWTLDDGVFISDSAPVGIAAPESASKALAGAISTMYPNTDAESAATTPYTLAVDTSKSVIVNDPRFETAEAFTSAMDGVLLVYPLATPEELQLSQEQINILLADLGLARNFGSRTNMLNTWMKLAQGYPVPEEELHMLRPTMQIPHDVILRPSFEDFPEPVPVPGIVDTPAAEPEENITESEES